LSPSRTQARAAGSSAGGKRPCPPVPGDREVQGPRLNLVTALPLSVWQEHLGPWLSVEESVRLRCVCKTLREVVKHWPTNLLRTWTPGIFRTLTPKKLRSALSSFPATESLAVEAEEPLAPAEESRLVELLRGHGGTLKSVRVGGHITRFFETAVREGALPNLTSFDFYLGDAFHREILSGGVLRLLEEVEVGWGQREQPMALLEPLRRLPHLRRLTLSCEALLQAASEAALEPAFPPFIPPSLKSLTLKMRRSATVKRLLCALPSMLQASGASLEEFEFSRTYADERHAEDGAALAQVLRQCSSTLKAVTLNGLSSIHDEASFGAACTQELAPGLVSCCDTLEVLRCHWAVFSALPATCPTFPRLTKLRFGGGRNEQIDFTPAARAWEFIASGRLPALATLEFNQAREVLWGGHDAEGAIEVLRLVVRAFEAVGGTLRRLDLSGFELFEYGTEDTTAAAGYELGTAIGKLRRLRYLEIEFLRSGREYHALGRGMAVSGGCPELFELCMESVERNLDMLTYEPSLIVPSVRDLTITSISHEEEEEGLLLCCGLVQLGYKHRVDMHNVLDYHRARPCPVEECMRAILCRGGMNAHL
jgi:hypothetical protein